MKPGKSNGSFQAEFTTGPYTDYYLGVVKNEGKQSELVIDNLAVDEVK